MTDKKTEALKLALESLENLLNQYYADTTTRDDLEKAEAAITAIREALADSALDRMAENARELGLDYEPSCKTGSQCTSKCQQCEQSAQQQEPVTVLPDGSAFAVMSYPLPKDHWLYADRQYNDGEYEPVELGKPVLTHELRDAVVSAVRYAIRGATNCGKEVDFDPDALVKNAVYALCGPFTLPQPAQQQEPVARSKAYDMIDRFLRNNLNNDEDYAEYSTALDSLYTSPPASKPWVEITPEELMGAANQQVVPKAFAAGAAWANAKLREKNA